MEAAFETAIHVYEVDGQIHPANESDPALPGALASVVHGVASLNDFRLEPQHVSTAAAITPEFTTGSSHYMAPADFAIIYNTRGLYNNSIDGAGQSIAVIGRSNFNLSDVRSFRSQFGLPAQDPVVVLTAADPGIVNTSELQEASLDVQWAGAIAKNQYVLLDKEEDFESVKLESTRVIDIESFVPAT